MSGGKKDALIWCDLVHLGTEMWERTYSTLQFDETVWNRYIDRMVERKLNAVLIDLGEGLVYPSHPELAIEGSWSVEKMRKELARLRSLGLEPIPKLNFSTAHDAWMGEWGRMVSTSAYYRVCAELIRDVCEIFDHPRLFHIGYDEENYRCQRGHGVMTVRQGDLWWSDFYRIVAEVEKNGARAWMWSDFIWHHEAEFLRRMSRGVLQSNWYYWPCFDLSKSGADRPGDPERFKQLAYVKLDEAGFDQICCGSTWNNDTNFGDTVKFCREVVAPQRLKGFLNASWAETCPKDMEKGLRAIDQVGAELCKIKPICHKRR